MKQLQGRQWQRSGANEGDFPDRRGVHSVKSCHFHPCEINVVTEIGKLSQTVVNCNVY
jgi:hypothetical protein